MWDRHLATLKVILETMDRRDRFGPFRPYHVYNDLSALHAHRLVFLPSVPIAVSHLMV